MPSGNFLQAFHDLAQADEKVRCGAAIIVRQNVTENPDSGANGEEDLQYALRRLVRGVQSSRQCCRQGFSLALSELLEKYPKELGSVLQQIRKNTGLQAGLRSGELKERLLGRIFAYAAVLEAGFLKSSLQGDSALTSVSKSRRQQVDDSTSSVVVAKELCSGLLEVYGQRQYMRAPVAHLQVQACSELCSSGFVASVPAALEAWNLDEKFQQDVVKDRIDIYAAGLVLELRLIYEDVVRQGTDTSSLKAWPTCVRNDIFARPPALASLVRALGTELIGLAVGDAVPFPLASFCRWLLCATRAADRETVQRNVWLEFDAVLFPENAASSTQAQGLRGLGELATCLHEGGAASRCPEAEALFIDFFVNMKQGFALLFQMVCWQRAHTHAAAIYANNRIAEAVGASCQGVAPQSKSTKKKHKQTRDQEHQHVANLRRNDVAPGEWELSDDTRLCILAVLQQHKGFGSMKAGLKRQWQQALVVPLSASGIRSRCVALFTSLVASDQLLRKRGMGDDTEGESAARSQSSGHKLTDARVFADQLMQLASHGHASDEVILSALCFLFNAAYLQPSAGSPAHGAVFSLRAFCESTGLGLTSNVNDDLSVPVLNTSRSTGHKEDDQVGADVTDGDSQHWRAKFWSVLTSLLRRTSPDTAEKHVAAFGASDVGTFDAAGGQVLKTLAFHGCLSDGSLWLMRLHEWWDYVLAQAPIVVSASPRSAPKKKRKLSSEGSLRLVADLEEVDIELRKRCLKLSSDAFAVAEDQGYLSVRQRNALYGLPLSISLGLLQSSDEERKGVRDCLTELIDVLEKIAFVKAQGELKKRSASQRAETLAVVPRMACELFVNASGAVKEAARTAWRELGDFASDETVASLCASVCDADDAEIEDEDALEDNSSSEEDDSLPEAKAARIAQFQRATAALAKARADIAEGDDAGVVDDEVDEILLNGDEVLGQLLDDEDSAGGRDDSLLNSFASSGLDSLESSGTKITKRQKQLRRKQEELARKFRELELLELFVQRFVDKKPVTINILKQLFDALVKASKRAGGAAHAKAAGGETDGSGPLPAKRSKADNELRRLEADLARRLSEMLSKALKQVSRASAVREICKWHSAEDWAEHARTFFATLQSTQLSAALGQRSAEVAAALVYWLCSMHRARTAGGNSDLSELACVDEKGWELAEEILGAALKDWSGKRDSERWCGAMFCVFANRASQVLVRLPWLEQIRGGRNVFVQRAQVTLVATQVIRSLPPTAKSTTTFIADFAMLCSELLNRSLEAPEAACSATSSSQKQKLRLTVVKALFSAMRIRSSKRSQQGGSSQDAPLDATTAKSVLRSVQKILDALPAKRGEVYQLCLQVQRALRKTMESDGGFVSKDSHRSPSSKSQKRQRNGRGESGEVASVKASAVDSSAEVAVDGLAENEEMELAPSRKRRRADTGGVDGTNTAKASKDRSVTGVVEV
eukprot:TRINITY_DN43594_c0_g1_i1.p1 TRINITY_DN43594_c0_g1~~TRINITY_DN43594_c0_g1_i1.p1  ORF type:complete len:1510 (-),score=282.23 TRINITY_DN43594_c0_g1_i1:86-4441(-)